MECISLHRYPFLRLLFPFALGICCGSEAFFRGYGALLSDLLLPVLVLVTAAVVGFYFSKRYADRWYFGTSLFLFCFLLGAGLMIKQLQQTVCPLPSQETVYRVELMQAPEQKERTVLCRVWLTHCKDSLTTTPLHHRALLYVSKDSLSEQLQSGDELLVYARFSPPSNGGYPDAFDYRRYLIHKGVSVVGVAYPGRWKRVSHTDCYTLRQEATRWRASILSLYRRLGFRDDAFAVLSALTVGYKEELSEEIRETYSISGASHILALSGLHIGFLYAFLLFCLRVLPNRWRGIALIRTVLILCSLWTFALMTGLSPSVVRSVIMFSLFALAALVRRNSYSFNTLALTAFFMLLYAPSWLYDVGFQLSFVAVASILLIQPLLERLLPMSNGVLKYLCGLLTVSVAAQIGTAPLVLLYFSRFPTHFLLTNLLVIPLVSLVMYVAVLMLLLTPLPVVQALVASVVKGLIEVLNGSVRWVEQLPYASIDDVWVDGWEVTLLYLLLLLLLWYVAARTAKRLSLLLAGLLLLGSYHLYAWVESRPHQSILFYSGGSCPVVHCIAADGHSWLAYADSTPDRNKLHKGLSRYWARMRLDAPCHITADYTDARFSFYNHILSFSGTRVCLVSDDRWTNKVASQPLSVDYLYVCRGYHGCLAELLKLFSVRCVVLDSALTDYRRKNYEAECRQQGIELISLSEKGSVRFLL